MKLIYLSLALLFNSFICTAQYIGGRQYIASTNYFFASTCTALENTNVFFGGSADGFAQNFINNSVCAPLENTNVFFGGNADGFAHNFINNSVCAPLENTNVFFGGNADGFAHNFINNSVCAPLENTNVFFGGNADGFAQNFINNSVCTPIENTNVFFGGRGGGFSVKTFFGSIALPVKLVDFKILCIKDEVKIEWTTTMEENNDFFTIEASADGKNFKEIYKMKGAGTTKHITKYAVKLPQSSDFDYFRLVQTNYDKSFEKSNIIASHCKAHISTNVSPNPSKGVFEINHLSGASSISVFDMAGVQVFAEQTELVSKSIDLSFLNNGVYLLKINNLNEVFMKKILIHR